MDERIDFTRTRPMEPPEDLWPAIAGELDRRGRNRFARRVWTIVAAFLVVVLAVVLTPAPRVTTESETAGAGATRLEALQAQSARLESRLAGYRGGVVESNALEGLFWLEAELGWLDEQLTRSPGDADLWRQRIELLEELNRRYARDHWASEVFLAGI